jgi:hypothetical protein
MVGQREGDQAMRARPEPGGRRFLLRRIGREKLGCDFVSDAADRLVVGVPDAECIADPWAQADLCRDFFRRAVALELSFFEAAYADRT